MRFLPRTLAWIGTFIVASALAACGPSPLVDGPAVSSPAVSVATVPFAPVAFRCPPAGTLVTRAGGGTVRYAGVAADDPAACLVNTLQGQQRWLYNLKNSTANDAREFRRAFANLLPFEAGREVTYSHISYTAGGQGRGDSYNYRDRWRVIGIETIQLASQTRNTIVLHRTQEGVHPNTFRGDAYYWIDVETGADLRRVASVVRGNPWLGPVETISIAVPAAAASSR